MFIAKYKLGVNGNKKIDMLHQNGLKSDCSDKTQKSR